MDLRMPANNGGDVKRGHKQREPDGNSERRDQTKQLQSEPCTQVVAAGQRKDGGNKTLDRQRLTAIRSEMNETKNPKHI